MKIAATKKGEKVKNIYVIHGWTYTIKPWTPVVSILKSRGYNVIQLKVPGLTTNSDTSYTITDYVNWLDGELQQVNKNDIVIAHSNGGRIVLNYLNKFPGKFNKLILIGSAGIYDDRRQNALKKQVMRAAAKVLSPIKKIPLARKVVYKVLGVSDYNEAPKHMKKTLSNMIESDKKLVIPDSSIETVLIWGSKDNATPLWMGEKLHKALSGSKLIVEDTWGHAPYITHPYELANLLTKEVN